MKRILSAIMLSITLFTWSLPLWAGSTPQVIATVGSGGANFSSIGNQTIVTGATNGTRVYNLTVTSTDTTTAHVMTCQIFTVGSVVTENIGVSIPANSGVIATNPAVNLLPFFLGGGVDQNQNQFITLNSGDIIRCNYATALSSGALMVYAQYGSF
jgi:hypothetical protein